MKHLVSVDTSNTTLLEALRQAETVKILGQGPAIASLKSAFSELGNLTSTDGANDFVLLTQPSLTGENLLVMATSIEHLTGNDACSNAAKFAVELGALVIAFVITPSELSQPEHPMALQSLKNCGVHVVSNPLEESALIGRRIQLISDLNTKYGLIDGSVCIDNEDILYALGGPSGRPALQLALGQASSHVISPGEKISEQAALSPLKQIQPEILTKADGMLVSIAAHPQTLRMADVTKILAIAHQHSTEHCMRFFSPTPDANIDIDTFDVQFIASIWDSEGSGLPTVAEIRKEQS